MDRWEKLVLAQFTVLFKGMSAREIAAISFAVGYGYNQGHANVSMDRLLSLMERAMDGGPMMPPDLQAEWADKITAMLDATEKALDMAPAVH